MNKAVAVFVLLIIVVLLMAIGFLGNIFYQKYYTSSNQQELNQLRVLKSKLVLSILAYGEVKDISGDTITLSSGGDSAFIKIDPTANIGSVGADGKYIPVNFSDIKVGQNIQVEISLLPDNQLEGSSVLITD